MLFLAILMSLSIQGEAGAPLTRQQENLYNKLTNSVAAPCCKNAIPVAHHESGMALYIRDFIKERVVAGESEKKIFKDLDELRLGQQNLPVIFTIPETNSLGIAAWLTPFLIIIFGVVGIFYFLTKQRARQGATVSDAELLEMYRPAIMARIKAMES